MIAFITLIAALCSQSGVGHGNSDSHYGLKLSRYIREEAFATQSACTKRLFKACTSSHKITGALLPKDPSCLVENL